MQGVGRQPLERPGKRQRGPVARLEREQRSGRRRVRGRASTMARSIATGPARVACEANEGTRRWLGLVGRRGPRPRPASAAGGGGSPASRRPPSAVTRPSPGARRRRPTRLAPRPARRLVEQRVLVEVGVVGQPVGRRAVAEDRPDRRPEDLGEVEVDRPHGPVEVDLLVHEQPGGQEHLERAERRLVEGQPALGRRTCSGAAARRRPVRPRRRSGRRRAGRSRGCRR